MRVLEGSALQTEGVFYRLRKRSVDKESSIDRQSSADIRRVLQTLGIP